VTAARILVPTRGRPESICRQVKAFDDTAVFEIADVLYIIDADDPRHDEYQQVIQSLPPVNGPGGPQLMTRSSWQPLVPKLNAAARFSIENDLHCELSTLVFLGDDHIPRTGRWLEQVLNATARWLVVYGRDGFQDQRLPTWWAMSRQMVQLLGGMVPAPVSHLYCDDVVKALGEAAGVIKYLPDVLVEHMHPLAGKGRWDEQYRRVNHPELYARDRAVYESWRASPQFLWQVDRVAQLAARCVLSPSRATIL